MDGLSRNSIGILAEENIEGYLGHDEHLDHSFYQHTAFGLNNGLIFRDLF